MLVSKMSDRFCIDCMRNVYISVPLLCVVCVGNVCKRVFVAIEDDPDSFSFLVLYEL